MEQSANCHTYIIYIEYSLCTVVSLFLGFEFDTGIHYVGEMSGNTIPKFLMDQLTEGQLGWSPLDPEFDKVVLGSSPKDSRVFPILSGVDNFRNALLENFPEEKNAIGKYMDLLRVNIYQY